VTKLGYWMFLGALAVAGWYAWQRYEIRGLDPLRWVRRDASGETAAGRPAVRLQPSLRVASFHLRAFGPAKAERPELIEVIAQTIRQFDVVAIQGVHSPRPDTLRTLLEQINADGRHYGLLVGPEVGRATDREQYAFVFDQATIEVDHAATYTIDDPDDLLRRPPLVGWFRARGPPADQAFTFTLVNVHADLEDVAAGLNSEELRALQAVFFSVRDDGRGEDDVILLGTFHADDQRLGDLERIPGLLAAISGKHTNTRQTRQLDNLLFQLPATGEYTGRNGVFDFLREFNLTLEQALEVSDHLPVWAEFSVYEGGVLPATAMRRD
jgi:deoxyribonuclease-1-like protein